MKNTETYKIVRLPTTEATRLWQDTSHKTLSYYHNVQQGGKGSEHPYFENQHLYAISDEPIKEGDWVLFGLDARKPTQVNNIKDKQIYLADCKKIIATTDPKLLREKLSVKGYDPGLDGQIPQSFIKLYAEQGGIDEVTLRTELFNSGERTEYLELKLTDNNEVVVVEEILSKEEIAMIKAEYLSEIERYSKIYNAKDIIDRFYEPEPETYSREEVEKAFNESRLTHPMLGFKHLTFEEYAKENLK